MTESKRRLDAHHGGAHFHDVMVRSFEGRFSEDFWALWDRHVASRHGDDPTYVDFGCGPGLMLEAWRKRWPRAKLHGVELQPYMLKTAHETASRVGARVFDQDLHTVRLPLSQGSVDAILCAVTIHEMREPVGMLQEARRLLTKDGCLFVMDWVRVPLSQYLGRFDDDALAPGVDPEVRADRFDHFMEHNKYSREDLTWLLTHLGFEVETTVERGGGQFVWAICRPR